MEKRKVAVFDVDGTIFRSSLTAELVERLIEKGIFPASTRDLYTRQKEEWLDRQGNWTLYMENLVKTFLHHVKGIPYDTIANIAGEVIEEKKNRVYRYTRDLAKEYKDKGYFLLAISHSPKFIVDGFCYEQRFDKAYGSLYELGPQEAFTGAAIDWEYISNKSNVLKRAVEKENLTLEGSIGVGDTESDISILEMVEMPIAFNPNAILYRHAKLNGWKIIVERKDVIYEM